MPAGEAYVVETRGIGKPDYSKEISLGRIRPGLTLKYRQSLKLFGFSASGLASPYPYVIAPIAPGGRVHLIDFETGLALPYTIPAGYFCSVVQIAFGFNEDSRAEIYLDTAFTGYLMTASSGDPYIWSNVAPFSTLSVDPTASLDHAYDIIAENLGGGNMMGTISIYTIIEALGTKPLPTTKTVKCKFCGHEWTVPQETTKISCPNCRELNIYLDLSGIKQL